MNLNRNISNIIYKYIDYSLENLNKNLNPTKTRLYIKIKNDITFEDILTIIFRYGYKSFFIRNCYVGIISQLDKMKKPDYIKEIWDDSKKYYCIVDNRYPYDRSSYDILSFREIFE